MPFKLLALQQAFGPFQSFVARRKFKRHYEDFTPIPVEKFKRRIFEGHFALGVRKCRYEAVPPKRIFRDGEIVAEARLAVFGTLIAVVVVAGAEHIRDFPVETRKRTRHELPLGKTRAFPLASPLNCAKAVGVSLRSTKSPVHRTAFIFSASLWAAVHAVMSSNIGCEKVFFTYVWGSPNTTIENDPPS